MPSPSTVRQPPILGGRQERRAARVVHEVGHDLARPEQRGIDGQLAPTLAHAERRGVHDQVSGGDVHRRPDAADARRQRGGRLRGGRRPVDDDHLPATGLGQREHDGSRRTAGAEHGDGQTAGLDVVVEPERVDEPAAVRALPRRRPVRRRTRRCWRPARAVTVGDGRSTRPATSVLWGIVTESPSQAQQPSRVRARRRPGRRARGRRGTPSPARRPRRRRCAWPVRASGGRASR